MVQQSILYKEMYWMESAEGDEKLYQMVVFDITSSLLQQADDQRGFWGLPRDFLSRPAFDDPCAATAFINQRANMQDFAPVSTFIPTAVTKYDGIHKEYEGLSPESPSSTWQPYQAEIYHSFSIEVDDLHAKSRLERIEG